MKQWHRWTNKLALGGCALALGALAVAPAQANIVQDPSFASGFGGVWSNSVYWNVDNSNPAPGNAQDAANGCPISSCVDTSALPASGYLFQDLATVAGQSYNLSFELADGALTFSQPTQLIVLWGSDVLGNDPGTVVFNEMDPALTPGYTEYVVDDLLATSSTTQLAFIGEQGNIGSFQNLDNVDVELPEPASLSLLCVGFAGAWFARRRKRA